MKTFDLFSTLRRNPSEFRERVSAVLSVRWETSFSRPPSYEAVESEKAMELLNHAIRPDFAETLADPNLMQIEKQISGRLATLPADAPFGKFHNGDTRLGRLCYAVTRLLRPQTVIETGVCYGVTSAYILAALEANGQGRLFSIDLPPLGKDADDYVGWLVPGELQKRWTLQRGTSRRLLSPLLAKLGNNIDLFIHDSLHTYKNMNHEFETVWPAIRGGGVLISDDIEGNSAFLRLTRFNDLEHTVVIQEKNKDALLGVAVKRA